MSSLAETVEPTVGTAAPNDAAAKSVDTANVQPHDFRAGNVIPAAEMRAFRSHQLEFVSALGARLSLFLRLDAVTRLAGLQTVTYQRLAQGWSNPTHLTLFKIEPLRGVGVLEIPPALGSALLDRLMGGTGAAGDSAREFSEIEKALLEQTAGLVLNEWCARWRGVKELKPTILSQESHGRYVQAASPEAVMVLILMEARVGQCSGTIRFAVPYSSIESLIPQIVSGRGPGASTETPKAALKWNPCFDDMCVPVNAEWEGLEMAARDLLTLKVGDVLKLDPHKAGQVRVSVAEQPRFRGRAGTLGGNWAVELMQTLHS